MLTYRLQTPYILGAQKKILLRRFFVHTQHMWPNILVENNYLKVYHTVFFGVQKDKSFTVVSFNIMKEDSYSEPAIRRVEMPCCPEHTKPLETRLFYRTTPIFCFYAQIIGNNAPLFMHSSFAKLLPWFYILGAQKNRLIEMVLQMF